MDGFPEKRPWWCQDPSCTPAASDTGAQLGSFDARPGYSGFCCGTVPQALTFTRHGQRHDNDGHLCFRSAIRGVVMLEVNEGDLDSVMRVAARGILARDARREFSGHWYTGRESGWTA